MPPKLTDRPAQLRQTRSILKGYRFATSLKRAYLPGAVSSPPSIAGCPYPLKPSMAGRLQRTGASARTASTSRWALGRRNLLAFEGAKVGCGSLERYSDVDSSVDETASCL